MIGNVAWLWLLTALVIPIAIHLWNQKPGSPQLLGTFRFLPSESVSKANRMELHEVLLLALRMLLLVTATFLLADIFLETEKPEYNSIHITENENQEAQQLSPNNLVLNISTTELNSVGWWNYLSQIDHDYNTDLVIAEGDFSQSRFQTKRPGISADVEWISSDTKKDTVAAVWSSSEERYAALFFRDNQHIDYKIAELTDVEVLGSVAVVAGDTVAFTNSIFIQISSEASPQIQEGLSFVADYWNIDSEIVSLEEISRVVKEDETFTLHNLQDENNFQDFISAGSMNGPTMRIKNLDTTVQAPKPLLESQRYTTPILWQSDEYSLTVNGEISEALEAWFYAGVGHHLIKISLGIVEQLSPMPEEMRAVKSTTHNIEAGNTVQTSMRLWLFVFLIALWAAERILAPRRGM